jgi:acetylornithine/N-succinyldiaminopimelate aminotransferase
MAAHPDKIRAHRGLGLIRGLELDPGVPVGSITSKALEEGLLINSAGSNVLRFVPPLIITEKEVDEAVSILEKCFA